MRVLTGIGAVARPPVRAVVTIGVFDGVHVAHQALIRRVVRLARRLRGTSVVITFDPDPQTVLDPFHDHPALMPLDERVRAMEVLGADWVWVLPFTRAFSRMRAETFARSILVGRLRAAALIVGERFVFGSRRQGGMDTLRAIGSEHGMRVIAARQITRGPEPVSSSRIRRLIRAGQLAQARRLLGRRPSLYGEAVRGAGRGRRLGFPTVNVRLTSHVLPPQGVYAVRLERAGTGRLFHGVMNLGVRPTFGPGPLTCEIHLLNFHGSFRGPRVSVELLARLRGERCFEHPDALVRQIRHDVARARRLFSRLP